MALDKSLIFKTLYIESLSLIQVNYKILNTLTHLNEIKVK